MFLTSCDQCDGDLGYIRRGPPFLEVNAETPVQQAMLDERGSNDSREVCSMLYISDAATRNVI